MRTIELLNFVKFEYISQFISICFDFNGNNRVISFLNLHFDRIKLFIKYKENDLVSFGRKTRSKQPIDAKFYI